MPGLSPGARYGCDIRAPRALHVCLRNGAVSELWTPASTVKRVASMPTIDRTLTLK